MRSLLPLVAITLALLGALAPRRECAAAGEREFVYAQSTGKLTLDGAPYSLGYSGKGAAKNDPDKEGEKNAGPIPRGVYRLGAPREFKGMANCFDLSPVGHDAHGRTQFLIHGDSMVDPGSASEGCIILPAEVRRKIAGSGVSQLRVVRD